MDDAIRSLERRLMTAEGDLALAREYRRALERLEPAGWRLDALEGALCVRTATGVHADPRLDPPPRWELVGVGGRAPALAPRGPGPGPLRQRWSAVGRARWVSPTVVLIEALDRTLEARCTRTGRVLWDVPAVGPGHPPPFTALDDVHRRTILGWAVAPWGAVALTARFEAQLERRRRGSASWRPRATERELPARRIVELEATLQVLVPPGGAWSAERPQEVAARAAAHEPLADGDLVLEGWEDDLLALALDAEAPRFAVRWRDQEQDWAVYDVGAGDDGAAWVAPSPWSAAADEDPVGRSHAAASPGVEVDLDRVRLVGPGRQAWPIPPDADLDGRDAVAALLLDEGALVRTRDAAGRDALWTATGDALVPRPLAPGTEAILEDLELRLWHEGPLEPIDVEPRTAMVLPVRDLLLVQAGPHLTALEGSS